MGLSSDISKGKRYYKRYLKGINNAGFGYKKLPLDMEPQNWTDPTLQALQEKANEKK